MYAVIKNPIPYLFNDKLCLVIDKDNHLYRVIDDAIFKIDMFHDHPKKENEKWKSFQFDLNDCEIIEDNIETLAECDKIVMDITNKFLRETFIPKLKELASDTTFELVPPSMLTYHPFPLDTCIIGNCNEDINIKSKDKE